MTTGTLPVAAVAAATDIATTEQALRPLLRPHTGHLLLQSVRVIRRKACGETGKDKCWILTGIQGQIGFPSHTGYGSVLLIIRGIKDIERKRGEKKDPGDGCSEDKGSGPLGSTGKSSLVSEQVRTEVTRHPEPPRP
jgi:hypothetical protein